MTEQECRYFILNIGRFLLLHWGASCAPVTPRATPATTGNHRDQHIQPITNEEKVTNDSDWSESEKGILESVQRILESK